MSRARNSLLSLGILYGAQVCGCGAPAAAPTSPVRVAVPPRAPAPAPAPAPTPTPAIVGPHTEPRVRWRVQTGGPILASACELDDGSFVVGSVDGAVYRVDAGGRLLYTVHTGAPIRARALALGAGRVLVGNEAGLLSWLDAQGAIERRVQLSGAIAADPVLGHDGRIYVPAGGLYAIDRDGYVLYRQVEATTLYSAPSIGPDGSVNYRTVDGRMVTLDAAGHLKEELQAGLIEVTANFVADSAHVRYEIVAHDLLQATREDGSPLWSYALGAAVDAPLILSSSGMLLVSAHDGILYALH